MKVLLAAGVDLSLPGGLETHVLELARGLASRGHEVSVFGRPASLPPLRMVDRISPRDHDVVHHHGGSWPAGADAGERYVKTLHFCTAAKMETYVKLGRFKTLAHPGNWRGVIEERASVRRRGRFIAVAERVRRDFVRFYGLDPARATVIPNGASFGEPAEARAAVRRRWRVPEDAVVMLTVGRADFVKGHALLERAWSLARTPRAWWVAVGGSAPSWSEGRVVTGPVPHAEVLSAIHAADFAAMPSWYEGCSIAMLEMMAGGLFTLAHAVGNADEVIRPRENGEIVAPRVEAWTEALRRALASPPVRRGALLGDEFRWSSVVERVERLYREVAPGA